MTPHLITLPFVLPLLGGALLMALSNRPAARHLVAGTLVVTELVIALLVWHLAGQGGPGGVSYQVGNWPWPYGITLHLDGLSATMLMLSATVGAIAVLPGIGYDDRRNRYALALAQFQLAGINGSFLAGDLFNLFVMFEVLLISSYALMVHGHGRVPRAGLVYTVVNLTGSSIFLLGIALLYGATGSLNLVDLAQHLQNMPADVAAMGYTGAWLVALVFALKSALVPIGLWLPGAYAVAGPMAITLFALLTKVGVYALMRVFGPWFTSDVAELAAIGEALRVGALATIVLGALLALGSRTLRQLAGALVMASVATALLAVTVGGAEAMSAALFYMVHSTLAAGGIFLVTAFVMRLRGAAHDQLDEAPAITHRGPAMLLFLGIAVVVTGMPPLSGFVAKVGVLQLLAPAPGAGWSIGVVLAGSLVGLLAVVRAGNAIFLRSPMASSSAPAAPGARVIGVAALLMLALSVLMTAMAGPFHAWTDAAGKSVVVLPEAAASPAEPLMANGLVTGGGRE